MNALDPTGLSADVFLNKSRMIRQLSLLAVCLVIPCLAVTNSAGNDESQVRELVDRLSSGTVAEQIDAESRLALMGPKGAEAAASLIIATRHQNVFVRRWAVHALEKTRPPAKAVMEALTECLEDKDPAVRTYAAFALSEIAPARLVIAMPALCEALWDSNSEVQARAADILASMGFVARDAIPYLLWALCDRGNGIHLLPPVRRRVHMIPPKSETEEALPFSFFSAAEIANVTFVDNGSILRIVDYRGTGAFIQVPRKAALIALGEMGRDAKGALPFISQVIGDQDPEISRVAEETFKKIKASIE